MVSDLLVLMFCCSFWRAHAESLARLASGLKNGLYVIERVNYVPSPHFHSLKEAKEWIKTAQTHPGAIKPERDYFRLYISGPHFIVRQLLRRKDGAYGSRSNFFVSVNSEAPWAFEESANRVTVATNLTRLVDGGPIAGLLQTAHAFFVELKYLGLGRLDLSSATVTGTNRVRGRTTLGVRWDGRLRSDELGHITNITCTIDAANKRYEQNFEIEFDAITKQPSSVTVRDREMHDPVWHLAYKFAVKRFEPLPPTLDMSTFWEKFTNSNTLLVYYNAKSKATLVQQPSGLMQQIHQNTGVSDTHGYVRDIVLLIMVLSTLFGLLIAYRAIAKTKRVK